MARGVNKVILIGNLGADPDVRYMPNGSAVANVTVATSTVWRDKQSGELVERTEWHRVVFFSRLAEIVGEYLRKGSKIYIEGSLRTRKWQDKTTVWIVLPLKLWRMKCKCWIAVPGHGRQGEGANQTGDFGHDQDAIPEFNQGADDHGNFDDDIPFKYMLVYWVLALTGFVAGFIDTIAGGGGMITLPAYLMAGLPPHIALGTNKLSGTLSVG